MTRFWVSVLLCATLAGCAGHSPVARQQEMLIFTATFEGPGKMSLSDTSQDTPLLWLQITAPIQTLVWREHTITVCTDYAASGNLGDVLNDVRIISRNRNVVLAGPLDGISARPLSNTPCAGLRAFELQFRDVFEVRRGELAELTVMADFKPSSATVLQIVIEGTGEGLDDNVSISYAIKGSTMSLVRSK